jgi:hypothetical protein
MRRRLGFLVLSIGVCSLAPRAALAQSGYLQPGDVAVTCVDTTGTGTDQDRLQITPLVALPAVTNTADQIWYTDLEADQSGIFYDFDENWDPVDIGGAKAAGEPVFDVVSGLIGPNEQVFLFQGYLDDSSGMLSPGVLLWGFQMSTDGGWGASPMDDVSALPTSLAFASVAVKSTGDGLWAYVGPTTGTRAALQAAIADPTNWMAGASCPTGFVVTDGADGGATDGKSDVSDAGMDANVDIAAGDVEEIDARDGGDSVLDQTTVIDAQNGAGGVSGSSGFSGAGGMSGTGGNADAGIIMGLGGVMGTGGLMSSGGAGGATGGMTGSTDAGIGGSPDAMVDGQALDATIDAKLSVMRPISPGCNCAVSDSGAYGSASSLGFVSLLGLIWRRRRSPRQPALRTDRKTGRAVRVSDEISGHHAREHGSGDPSPQQPAPVRRGLWARGLGKRDVDVETGARGGHERLLEPTSSASFDT